MNWDSLKNEIPFSEKISKSSVWKKQDFEGVMIPFITILGANQCKYSCFCWIHLHCQALPFRSVRSSPGEARVCGDKEGGGGKVEDLMNYSGSGYRW